ncbi:MAG: PEPxxWA-CTERM sorting domain-containing protein [Alphaproteobacteria bacterium]|nr:PEPxxWA-CTERM sorting domain-containing protein [Alphaproteobacteria bacterium]MBU1513419.1 PEPxxWA-CTERM sorting domain-containing protein [Alphaproteobacteria bacterium]MBU2096411.1 PEPxxWA-CTERM sorting domain-containing protein [Alphaproteobacteria bacterium]MBU2149897.1 PEPxxWA-CTERM sorting domain-containing protein [Alphaproteobacteria bacterium]MBU2308197.1 PEPxxWA-CTERM sorting domain-containing protein [Alphaproteobacteria bacterium]
MRLSLLGAAVAAPLLLSALPASAAIMWSFSPGVASPGTGFTTVNTFDTVDGITGSGFEIKTPPADGAGSPPANSNPSGTPYLAVFDGGSATIGFSGPVKSFQFDWGSIDSYNTLTIDSTGAEKIIVPGGNFINAANGDRVSPGTNGLFTVWGTEGETFQSITLTSSGYSFEIDNLATSSVPVPEPATWAMMILGFGGVGATMRRRRGMLALQTA